MKRFSFSLFNRQSAIGDVSRRSLAKEDRQSDSPGAAVDTARKIATANVWRDQYNPLRSLTMAQAVSWLEQAQRGEFADIQWAYNSIERRDADLLAIIERRTGAVLQMDWDIRTVEKRFKTRGLQFDSKLALDQQSALRGAYDSFNNLYAAVEHLCMATFRGFSHVQFLADGELCQNLNLLDHWNVLRDGYSGDWFWNPESRNTRASLLDPANRMDPAAYLIRVSRRPVNEIALIKFLRQNLSAKDWDAFLEIYGIPGWIITMPDNVPAGKESDYQTAAEDVAKGGSGALPSGSVATCADSPRGVVPFEQHLKYWTEKLVLAGTGGLLTMLTAPGSGTLAGSAHQEAFEVLARSEAARISELFQRSIDKYILAQSFPGKPALAYFELASNEEQDVGSILDHAVKISQAGGQVDWTQLSEKTGYKIVVAPPVAQPAGAGQFRNRRLRNSDPQAEIVSAAVDQTLAARNALLQEWVARLAALAAQPDLSEAAFLDRVEALIKAMPAELLTAENIAALAGPLEGALGSSVVNALLSAPLDTRPSTLAFNRKETA